MFKRLLVLLAVAGFTAGSAAPAFAKETKRKPRLLQVVYPVADLIVPIDMDNMDGKDRPLQTVESALMEVIRRGIAPASWEENGGQAFIGYFPLGMSLVVRQTAEAHKQIKRMLEELRQPQEIEVASQVLIVQVSNSVLERLGNESLMSLGREGGETTLDDTGVRRLLETAMGDRRTNVTQAPKFTCCNGQRVRLRVQDTVAHIEKVKIVEQANRVIVKANKEEVKAGVDFRLWPVVAADRRSVTMNLHMQLTSLNGGSVSASPSGPATIRQPKVEDLPVTLVTHDDNGNRVETPLPIAVQRPAISTLRLNRTLHIPDGKTAVLHLGKQLIEERTAHGPPILCDIPYVGRLFRNIGNGLETQHVLVLVTPRIVVQEEEEAISAAR